MSLSVEQINKLESENERLTKEVKQWKYEYEMLDACCELYSAKVKDLKAENEHLKKEFKIECLTDNTTGEKIYRSRLQITLQEIQEIAVGIRNATYQFGQEADQKFFNETLGKILQKISEVNK